MKSDLGERTKEFALAVVRFYVALPKTTEHQILGKQVIRAGTSVGAHYREAARARSDAEFVSKLQVGLQELDETIYWLELLKKVLPQGTQLCAPLLNEADQITAILTTCVKKARATASQRPKI